MYYLPESQQTTLAKCAFVARNDQMWVAARYSEICTVGYCVKFEYFISFQYVLPDYHYHSQITFHGDKIAVKDHTWWVSKALRWCKNK